MKKLILLALLAVIMAGCLTDGYEIRKSSCAFVDIVYDSCEYVFSNVTEIMAHKGNCKYCAERRKNEIKELVEQLKDK